MPLTTVGGIELYYELLDCTEPWRSGPDPVVFIHGLGGDHRMWLYQVPAFCARYPTVTINLRGHGRSARPDAEWSIADMARDIVRLLRSIGVERAHLIGLSLGGLVAQQFALDYPFATASLVLVGTFASIPDANRDATSASLRFIEENGMAVVAAERIRNAFSDHVDPVMRDYFIDRVAQNHKPSYVRAARAAMSFASTDRLGELALPVLVMVGEEDRVTPPPLSEALARHIVGARLARIAGAGHLTNLERPMEFNRLVLEFLDGLEESRRSAVGSPQ